MQRRRLSFLFLTALLSGPACQQQPQAVLADEPASAPAPAEPAIPSKAKLTLATMPPLLSRPTDAPDADKLADEALEVLRRAEKLLLKGQYAKAVPQFEKAKTLAPASPRVLRGLGLAYAGLGDQLKAQAELRASLAKAPNRAQVHLLLGRYAIARGEFDKARNSFRRGLLCSDAAAEQPDAAELLVRLATLLENQGYWTAALECYDRLARQLSANARRYDKRAILRLLVSRPERIMLARGRLLLKLQRTAEAAKLLERAYRRDKAHRQTARTAIQGLLAAGRFDRAEKVLMELLEEASMRDLAIESAVKICKTKKDPATPQRLLKAYLARGGSNGEFVIAMAEAAAELGAADAAADMLSEHLASSPDDAGTALRLAWLRAKGGDFAAAAGYYARLLAADAANLDRIVEGIRRLARYDVKKELIEALPPKAGEDPAPLAPAMLCVAGMMADATGRPALAGQMLARAVKEHPKFWPAYEILEAHHAVAGDFDALDSLAQRVARAAGESYFRYYLTGKVLLDQGQVEKAVDDLEEARSRQGGRVPTLLLLGRAYARQGNTRDAERRLLAGQALGPANVAVVAELFELYVRRRSHTEAGRVVLRFLRDNPQSAAGKLLAARYYVLIRRPQKARGIVRKLLLSHGDDVEVRLFDLRLALRRTPGEEPMSAGEARAAIGKVERVLKLDPYSADARQLKAALLSDQSRHDEAAAVLRPVFRRRKQDAVVAGAYLNALVKAGKDKAAAEEVGRIAARKRLTTPMRLMVLDALQELKGHPAAEKLLAGWLAAPADNTELGRLRTRALKVYVAAKHYDVAQELLDRWIASGLEPEKLRWLRVQKLRMFALAGKLDQARTYAAKFSDQEWKPYQPNRVLVLALMQAKDYAAAHKVLDAWAAQAQADRAKISDARVLVLTVYAEHKAYDELVKFGRKWMAADPRNEDVSRVAVFLLSRDQEHARALKLAEQWLVAVEKLPAPASAPAAKTPLKHIVRRFIIELLLRAEKKRDALKRARGYAKAAPESAALMRALMAALHANEKEKEYVRLMERLYKLDEDDPGVNNDLGYSWADRGVNLAKAERMIRKALAAKPGRVAFKDSLGWVFYKQAKFAAAERIFDQAVQADEAELHPIILDHAGDTCWRVGRTDKAVRLWHRAVRLAQKEKSKDREVRQVLTDTPAKIKAAESGGRPKVAPLGKGVAEPAGP